MEIDGGEPATPAYDSQDRIHYGRGAGHAWEYQSWACMECGNNCDIWEEVDTGNGGPFELWVYCPACDVQTFHPRVRVPSVEH
jgi:hypothetical protein